MSLYCLVHASAQNAAPFASFAPVRQVFRAVVSTVVPEAAALDERGWADLEALVEAALGSQPAALHRRLRLALRAIQYLPALRYGRFFTSLGPKQRAQFLSFLEDNSIQVIRLGFWGLRTLALLGYYGRLEAGKAIGYTPDPRGWGAVR
jgi:hypothetical protein